MLDQLIGLYIVCGVLKAHTHTRSFVFGHIQKRERERERRAKERLRRPELYSVHCAPVAHGERSIQLRRRSILLLLLLLPWKNRKEEASLESRSIDGGLFLPGPEKPTADSPARRPKSSDCLLSPYPCWVFFFHHILHVVQRSIVFSLF